MKNKNIITISYHKRFDSEGCVYNQAIKVTQSQIINFNNIIENEVASGYPNRNDYSYTNGYELYLRKLDIKNNIAFMNHTTTRFINLYLKLSLLDRNTCLLVR